MSVAMDRDGNMHEPRLFTLPHCAATSGTNPSGVARFAFAVRWVLLCRRVSAGARVHARTPRRLCRGALASRMQRWAGGQGELDGRPGARGRGECPSHLHYSAPARTPPCLPSRPSPKPAMGTDGRVAVAIGVAVAAASAASSLPLTTSRRRRPRHQVFWCLAFVSLWGCLGSVGIKRRVKLESVCGRWCQPRRCLAYRGGLKNGSPCHRHYPTHKCIWGRRAWPSILVYAD